MLPSILLNTTEPATKIKKLHSCTYYHTHSYFIYPLLTMVLVPGNEAKKIGIAGIKLHKKTEQKDFKAHESDTYYNSAAPTMLSLTTYNSYFYC